MENTIEKTLIELKQELVSLGMPSEEADAFKTKGQIMSVINTLKASQIVAEKPVEKVATLEDVETPSEKKAFEHSYISKATIMRDKLMAQQQVRFMIPCEAGEKAGVVEWRTDKNGQKYQFHVSGAIETVQLNGFKFIIPKGTFCNVPEQIAEVLSTSQQLTNAAGANISMDRIDDKTGRPMTDII